jgi:hypothetical protein
MCKKCVLCDKIHGEIYQRFERFFETENIDEKQIREFIRFIEFELNQENWNEVSCLIDSMHNSIKLKNNLSFGEIKFQNILVEIKRICIANPTSNSITELRESLSNDFIKLNTDLGAGIKKNANIDYKNEFSVLLASLEKIKEFEKKYETATELEEYILTCETLIVPLKNYIIFRMISFFEQRIYDILVTTINELPPDILFDIQGSTMTLRTNDVIDSKDASIGHLAVLGLNNDANNIDHIIYKILQNKIKNQRLIKLKPYSFPYPSFFYYFGNIIKINNSELLKHFSEKSHGKWSHFIKNLNKSRNQMTHELTNPKYSTVELEHEMRLMYILLQSFPNVLKFMLNYFSKTKNMGELAEIHKFTKEFLNEAECEMETFEGCIEKIKSSFIVQRRN